MAFSVPTAGQPNSTEDTKIADAITGLNNVAGRYHTIAMVTSGPVFGGGTATGTYFFNQAGTAFTSGSSNTSGPHLIEILSADHAVTNLTAKLRVKMIVANSTTSPGSTVLTAGLYPVTIGASFNLGTVISGSTAASSGLATSTVSRFNSGDFNLPSDGVYALGLVIATASTPAGMNVTLQLQSRSV